jgi:hypothetical protein
VRSALRIAVVVTVLAVPAVALAAGTGRTYAINCTREQYKPATIILTCGDAGIWLGKLKWSHWSQTKAVGSGTFTWNDCKPTCSAGHNLSRPVKVTLAGPKRCPGRVHEAFGRATFTFPRGGPPFKFRRTTFVCPY